MTRRATAASLTWRRCERLTLRVRGMLECPALSPSCLAYPCTPALNRSPSPLQADEAEMEQLTLGMRGMLFWPTLDPSLRS